MYQTPICPTLIYNDHTKVYSIKVFNAMYQTLIYTQCINHTKISNHTKVSNTSQSDSLRIKYIYY